jgi:hypothetical protein
MNYKSSDSATFQNNCIFITNAVKMSNHVLYQLHGLWVSNELRCHAELEDIILACVKDGRKQEVFVSETLPP